MVGIEDSKILLGTDIDRMPDGELAKKVEEVNVFARMNPLQKERIIKALRKNGHVVGYMGDGVNDAPSLHNADVGICVNTATDIAKEASDIILLEKSLKVIFNGVIEGRKVYGNIIKYNISILIIIKLHFYSEVENMISAGDFRNGVTFEEDGNVLQVIEFQHVKPGKGAAFVRTKTKNVITGSVVEKSYNPSAKYPTAYIERKEMTYSYNDEGLYYFMDNDTFEMIPVSESDLSDNFKFVKENEVCRILSYKGKVFGVEPPTFVTLEVTETEPGLKGNTATNTLKPAKVETGAEIRVPLFINEGDMIRIDTRTCEYMERA